MNFKKFTLSLTPEDLQIYNARLNHLVLGARPSPTDSPEDSALEDRLYLHLRIAYGQALKADSILMNRLTMLPANSPLSKRILYQFVHGPSLP